MVKYVIVSPEDAGVRLDNFLVRHLKKVPKSRIYRAIRSGEVRVDKGRAQASTRLHGGESVRIPPIESSEPRVPTFVSPAIEASLRAAVLYEDPLIIVLNKPAGLAVHGGSESSIGVIEALRLMYPHSQHFDLVHRLDKDTSGCLIIAKKRSALRALHEAMREGQIQKQYLALVAGHWPKHLQKVTLPLRKFQLQSGERMVVVDAETGKPCETLFKPLSYHPEATWVEATLITGRTHQIRVHCAQSGHPIVGDDKYGKKSINAEFKAKGMTRMALHAARLHIHCPAIAMELTVEAPLPEVLSSLFTAP
jgi:23S rRNA pseudouridine955/2504/2580 synthase